MKRKPFRYQPKFDMRQVLSVTLGSRQDYVVGTLFKIISESDSYIGIHSRTGERKIARWIDTTLLKKPKRPESIKNTVTVYALTRKIND